MDPERSPERIFPAHPLDQITQDAINPRPPYLILGFLTSEDFDASAMPT
jgi:hypothetical protein